MPKGRGFLGCSRRTRPAHPKVKRCDRLTRALEPWLSVPLHRRRFPQALRYRGSLAHGEPERHSSPGLKSGVFWRRRITNLHDRMGTLYTLQCTAERHRVNSSLAGYAGSMSGDMGRTSVMNTSSRLVPNATDLHETQPYPLVLMNITP